jgi:hypothetical protein
MKASIIFFPKELKKGNQVENFASRLSIFGDQTFIDIGAIIA